MNKLYSNCFARYLKVLYITVKVNGDKYKKVT